MIGEEIVMDEEDLRLKLMTEEISEFNQYLAESNAQKQLGITDEFVEMQELREEIDYYKSLQ